VLLAADLHGNFIDVKGIAIASVAEIEAIVEPDSIRNDVRRVSVAFICVHMPSLAISAR